MSVQAERREENGQRYQIGNITEEQKRRFDDLIKRNEDIFAKDENDFGRTGIIKYTIDTGDAKPIKQRAYRAGLKDRERIKEEIDRLLEKGAIRKSNSPWASPVVIVPKKNGKRRVCIDYRKINKVTRKDNHPLPRIDDMLDTFQKSEWFTSLDLVSGYFQVEMEERDIEKTAFITNEGLYEYTVMPFGLCNAPATFQRMMHMVLGDLIYTKAPVYIDDVNVHSKTFEQHLQDLEEVFDRIRKANLKLSLEKCHFCFQEIKFLGYIVGKDGIKVDMEKIEKVQKFPRPGNVSELRSFVGLASYFRRFVKDFSKIVKPLTELFQKDKNYEWKERQEKSFEELKRKLTEAPILIYPDFDKIFTLYTDASGYALGCVLSQEDKDGKERVVAYASRSLTKAEQNYATTEKECLAVIWGVEKFHHYLYGRKFRIVTDHIALKWLQTSELKGRRARWVLRLQPYDYEIIYKQGRKHQNADALSRIKWTERNTEI
jgi:hypothetical protein